MAKKNYVRGILAIVLTLGLVVIGCDNGTTGNGNDNSLPPGKVGVINFASSPPDAFWEIRVTPVAVNGTGDLASGYAATSSTNATDYMNGKAYLNQMAFPEMTFPTFDPNGTYTVVYIPSGGAGAKKKSGVQFSDGSTTLDINSMDSL
ncbi:MAG: hypothetical protein LBC88_00590 [Spirochaetaceae bacterium]|nr:hypothetical protein [Spirochaetaceae bacterium]